MAGRAVPAGAFAKPDELIGRGLVMPVIQNEPILPMKLAVKEAGSGLPVMIPDGKRAVSVRVNEVIGVAGYVLPGTRVDVLATASATDNKADTTTKVVLTNVQVLAAGTKMEQDGEQGKPMPVSVVTLLVDSGRGRAPDARRAPKARFSWRSAIRSTRPSPMTPGIRPAALLGQAPARSSAMPGRVLASRGPVADGLLAAAPVDLSRPRSKSSAETSAPKKSCARRNSMNAQICDWRPPAAEPSARQRDRWPSP